MWIGVVTSSTNCREPRIGGIHESPPVMWIPLAVLAVLIGVNIGPNITYVGSLATLLWRRILSAHDHDSELAVFTRLGLRTVPIALIGCTLALWLVGPLLT